MIKDATGIILAGGKNTRMGKDKSFLLLSGKPLIEILINKLLPLFKDLIIITNRPHLYRKHGIRIQKDILPDRGPLGGIYTGLLSSKSKYNFIVACDMPFINQGLIRYMLQEINDYDVIIVERDGRLHPLFAVYSKNCIKPIKNEIQKGNLKIRDFFKYVRVRRINEREIEKFDSKGLSFANINTPKDYRRLKYERI